jgi:hypothetical protein
MSPTSFARWKYVRRVAILGGGRHPKTRVESLNLSETRTFPVWYASGLHPTESLMPFEWKMKTASQIGIWLAVGLDR